MSAAEVEVHSQVVALVEVGAPAVVVEVVTVETAYVEVMTGAPGPQGTPGGTSRADLDAHIADSSPHPAYDDVASYVIDIENALI